MSSHGSSTQRQIAAALEQAERSADSRQRTVQHRIQRPWGSYECLDHGSGFQVKRISVAPGKRLSLQLHRQRCEHWVVVQGTAIVTRDERVFTLQTGESTFIPLGMKHRLENASAEALELIEVQIGGYLGEDDIVRFADDFGRHEQK